MCIYVSVIAHYADPVPESYSLEHIIDTIRSDLHRDLVMDIRAATSKTEVTELKKGLSQFFPTVELFGSNRLVLDSKITGIVQFDIDVQDNTGTDFDDLKNRVIEIPETIYAFQSPSGGLKFGILTDLKKNGDSLQCMKARYQQAYTLAQRHVGQYVTIAYDSSMETPKFPCYLSWDTDAYYNGDCAVLAVNDQCTYEAPAYTETAQDVSTGQIEALLAYIPTGLSYAERLPINFAVLGTIGSAGIPILFNHWTTDSRDKLMADLKDQCDRVEYGNIGHLVNVAKEHGYQPVTGRARRKLTVTPTEVQFDSLLPVEAGTALLCEKVQHFFDTGTDTFLNISTGAGKTEAILPYLRKPPGGKRILVLVPTHDLAEEIKQRIVTRVNHIKGKFELCEFPDLIQTYQEAGVAMPAKQCMNDHCLYAGECRYIRQFNDFHARVRIMTHEEFVNAPSAWLYGSKGSVPRHGGWKPDYIVIDENWIDKTDHVETLESEYPSIRNIINDMLNGDALIDAVENHLSQVLLDDLAMDQARDQMPGFQSMRHYIDAMRESDHLPFSPILRRIHDYIVCRDETLLDPIRLIGKRLYFSKISTVANRYRDIPTLYLDATADERIVKTLIPGVDYHSIKIKPNEGINLYQAENFNCSKGWLSDPDHLNQTIRGIQLLTAKYDRVGLISYKSLEDHSNEFDRWLAKECGIQIYGHFGDLRGIDQFKDVDCLLIVGRQLMPEPELAAYAAAVYGDCDMEADYMDVPVRMKDGSAMTLNSRRYLDDRVASIKNHFNDSETKQAIGRGRLIHGCPKDVYLFSNESLGPDIEVTGFFTLDDFIEPEPVTQLKTIGYCLNKPADLKQLGYSANKIKKDRAGIDQQLIGAGISKQSLTLIDTSRNKRQREYYVHCPEKLEQGLAVAGYRIAA